MPDNALTRQEVATAVAKRLGITVKDTERVVSEAISVIVESIESCRTVRIRGLGSFSVVRKKGRLYPCPRPGVHEGELFEIPDHNAVKFVMSLKLKDKVMRKPLVQ
jgi:nucleoid DNA-binding protein